MRMNDFEKFLKDNQLDVQSVTTPLMSLPNLINIVSKPEVPAKMKNKKIESDVETSTYKIQKMNTATTETINNKKLVDDAIRGVILTSRSFNHNFRTEKSTSQRYSKELDDKRRKRYSELLNERFFTFEPFRKKAKNGKVKKKIKLFDKKLSQSPTEMAFTIPTMNTNEMQNEVELTIINMNDEDQNSNNRYIAQPQKQHKKVKTNKAKQMTTRQTEPTAITNSNIATTGTEFMQRVHNNLLFKDKYTKTTDNLEDNVVTEDFSKTTFHPMINNQLFSKLHPKHAPKRVRISSHSYKYDIIYNNEPGRWSKNVVQRCKHTPEF